VPSLPAPRQPSISEGHRIKQKKQLVWQNLEKKPIAESRFFFCRKPGFPYLQREKQEQLKVSNHV
jgi:hypothetical protein